MASEKLFYNAVNIAVQTQYKELKKLIEKNGSWEKSWEEIREIKKSELDPEKEYAKMETAGVELFLLEEENYPKLLKETHFPPFGLYVKGRLPSSEHSVAIVGTRKATAEGKESAREFGRELAEAGCMIISGLALGIDAMGHKGALDGKGVTVAVLANGLDHIYPATNASLAEEIVRQNGALISEYPLGSPSLPYRFLERNRIVSGLSKGVLIIEAPSRSGTIATARFALEENRDVFVIPGPVRHSNFTGSHELIKQGASLVTTASDILSVLGIASEKQPDTQNLSPEEAAILSVLKEAKKPLSIDKIIEMSHLQAPIANQLVSFLLLKGLIEETEAGYATIKI
ncbi:MAG: DNA-processing protein DprA [Patescibacteria group bacterium]